MKVVKPFKMLMGFWGECGIRSLGNALRDVDSTSSTGVNTHDHLALFL